MNCCSTQFIDRLQIPIRWRHVTKASAEVHRVLNRNSPTWHFYAFTAANSDQLFRFMNELALRLCEFFTFKVLEALLRAISPRSGETNWLRNAQNDEKTKLVVLAEYRNKSYTSNRFLQNKQLNCFTYVLILDASHRMRSWLHCKRQVVHARDIRLGVQVHLNNTKISVSRIRTTRNTESEIEDIN